MGPPALRQVLDPLAVKLLKNRLYISDRPVIFNSGFVTFFNQEWLTNQARVSVEKIVK